MATNPNDQRTVFLTIEFKSANREKGGWKPLFSTTFEFNFANREGQRSFRKSLRSGIDDLMDNRAQAVERFGAKLSGSTLRALTRVAYEQKKAGELLSCNITINGRHVSSIKGGLSRFI